MPHRILQHSAALDQIFYLKGILLGALSASLAAANIPLSLIFDPFSAAPLTGNEAFLAMVAGSLGGAFISTQRRSTVRDAAQWSRRMALAAVCSIIFTPLVLQVASKLDVQIFGVEITIVPNAAVVLSTSAAVALFWKELIRWLQDRVNGDDDDSGDKTTLSSAPAPRKRNHDPDEP